MVRKYEKRIKNRFSTFVLFRNFVVSPGFTLIEATVASTVFAVAMTSIVGVYTSIQRLNRQSTALQALEQNIRFINEDLLKTISNGKVDYASYPGSSAPQPFTTDLYLRDKDDVAVHIYQSGDYLVVTKGGSGPANFTGQEIKVLNFRVYIWPSTNPFPKSLSSPKEQPTITIYADIQSNLGAADPTRMPFQTTIATREYPE